MRGWLAVDIGVFDHSIITVPPLKKKGLVKDRCTQPDTVLAWFEPALCTVTATVLGTMTKTMDHCPVRLEINLSGIEPRKPIYRNVKRRKRVKSDDEIGEKLKEELEPPLAPAHIPPPFGQIWKKATFVSV